MFFIMRNLLISERWNFIKKRLALSSFASPYHNVCACNQKYYENSNLSTKMCAFIIITIFKLNDTHMASSSSSSSLLVVEKMINPSLISKTWQRFNDNFFFFFTIVYRIFWDFSLKGNFHQFFSLLLLRHLFKCLTPRLFFRVCKKEFHSFFKILLICLSLSFIK